MEIDIIDNQEFLSDTQIKRVVSIARATLKYLNLSDNTEICITFINDKEMRQLNKSYRNIDRTTDILSFSQNFEPRSHILGDLVISYDTAKRHARKYGVTMDQELKKLLIHGVLHLLGHDHKKRKETEVMREMEKKIYDSIN